MGYIIIFVATYITILLIKPLFNTVSLISAKIKHNYKKEKFSCHVVKKICMGECQKEMKKLQLQGSLLMSLSPFRYFSLTTAVSTLKKGKIDKSIILFKKLAIKDNLYISKMASTFLSMIYAHKNNNEKALYWHYQFALNPHFPLVQYTWALVYSRICEEEVKEVGKEIYAQGDVAKMKKIFPKLNIQAYIDFCTDWDNFPKDYIQAYFWANLAVKNSFPTAKGLRDLIAEKMTPEDIEKASKFSY